MFTTRVLMCAAIIVMASCSPTTPDSDADADQSDGDSDEDRRDARQPSPTDDYDEDGFTLDEGDCDDHEAAINPMAIEVPDNQRDDDCDGEFDETDESCDCAEEADLPAAVDLCDERFLLAWEERYRAPDGDAASAVLARYGTDENDLTVRAGCKYSVLATGFVLGETSCKDGHHKSESPRQPGCDLYASEWDFCGEVNPPEPDPSTEEPGLHTICDTHQLVLWLKAPSNAIGFSFDFIYMSAEYPEFVSSGFNDTFYAILDRPNIGRRRNISYDDFGHEIEVDSAFFEHPPTTLLDGTGYDAICDSEFGGRPCGSSTGWLQTAWDIQPGEAFSLTFSIHDEGDGIYDSAVIIDNFTWSTTPVEPGTIPI